MTADADEDLFDGPCSVCGESVKGRAYVALGLGAVFSDEGDGVFLTPEGEPDHYEDWTSVPIRRAVHVACFENYCDGMLAETAHRRRMAEPEEPIE